jgi:tripartite-type tricarboxylate transporter receptor subunit TctC
MGLPLHSFLQFATAAAISVLPLVATAQNYPSRPVTMIVPSAAGAGIDMIGRILVEQMRKSLIIENVGGADGSIGAGRAARASPTATRLSWASLGTTY